MEEMINKVLDLLDEEVATATINYRGGAGLTVSVTLKGETHNTNLVVNLTKAQIARLAKKGMALVPKGDGLRITVPPLAGGGVVLCDAD